MDWLFDGFGTMLIGLAIGGAAGSGITWKIGSRNRNVSQRQRAGDTANQTQIGRDQNDSAS